MFVLQDEEEEEDAVMLDLAPQRQPTSFQRVGRANKTQPTSQLRFANQPVASGPQEDDAMDPKQDMISFGTVIEEEERHTPAVFVPVVKSGVQKQGTTRHAGQYMTLGTKDMRRDVGGATCFRCCAVLLLCCRLSSHMCWTSTVLLHCTTLHCIVLYCAISHRTVLYMHAW